MINQGSLTSLLSHFNLISYKFIIENDSLFFMLCFISLIATTPIIGEMYNFFKKLTNRKYFFVLFLVVLSTSFITRFHRISERSIWLDEDEQIGESIGYISEPWYQMKQPTLVRTVSRSSILPLNHFFTKLSVEKFGMNEFAARAPSAVWGAMSVGVFYLFIALITESLLYSVLGSFFYLSNPYLIFYSQEGRPYSLGFLAANLVFLSLAIFFRRGPSFKTFFPILGSSLLLFFSFGLQPWALLSGLGVLFLLGSYIWKKELLVAAFALLISAIIFLPYQMFLIEKSSSYLQNQFSIERFGNLFLRNANAAINILEKMFTPQEYFVAIILLASVFLLESTQKKIVRWGIYSFFILFFYFALFLLVVFSARIEWPIQDRYLILLIIPFYSLLVFSSAYFVRDKNIGHFRWLNLLVLSVLCIQNILSLPSAYGDAPSRLSTEKFGKGVPQRPDLRSLYSFLIQHGRPSDLVIYLDFGPPTAWQARGFIGMFLYYENRYQIYGAKISSVWKNPSDWTPAFIAEAIKNKTTPARRILFIFPTENLRIYSLDDLWHWIDREADYRIHYDYFIKEIPVHAGVEKAIIQFLGKLSEQISKKEQVWQVEAILAQLEFDRANWKEVRRRLNNLNSNAMSLEMKKWKESLEQRFSSEN